MSIVCIQYGSRNGMKERSNGTGYENRKTLALPSHLPERSLGKTDICGLGSLPGGEILAAGGVTVGIGKKSSGVASGGSWETTGSMFIWRGGITATRRHDFENP